MYRYIKHMPTNTVHAFDGAWLAAENSGFVECDEAGNILNIIDSTATVVQESAVQEAPKPAKKKVAAKQSNSVDDLLLSAEEALSADATRGL